VVAMSKWFVQETIRSIGKRLKKDNGAAAQLIN